MPNPAALGAGNELLPEHLAPLARNLLWQQAMESLFVFRLRLSDARRLEEAFALLIEDDHVASLSIQPLTLSAFFMATSAVGAPLVERIYQDGGLRWCSSHRVRFLVPVDEEPRPRPSLAVGAHPPL